MEENYPIHFGGRTIGKAQVKREGLYYRFSCRCRLSGDVVARLAVRCGDQYESLGILVPEGDGFSLNTRLPVKRLGQGNMEFTVAPNRVDLEGQFIPIRPEEPFAYMEKIKEAYLEIRNGQVGAIMKEKRGT